MGAVDIHFCVTLVPVVLSIAFLNRFLDEKVFYKKGGKMLNPNITAQATEQINIELEYLARRRSEDIERRRENVGQGNIGFLEESIEKINAGSYSAGIHSTWKILREVVANHKVSYSKTLQAELKDFAHSFCLSEPAESSGIVKTAWASALRKIDSGICHYVTGLKANRIPWYERPLGRRLLDIVVLIIGVIIGRLLSA
ncbi:MAG: hypothetical protein KAI03_03475 [Candidatus Aureabacteria bacterium]|nr:hypothetical protein [Candidatus Auribacterota bacterium]